MQNLEFSEKIIENTRSQGKNSILVIGEEPVTKKHLHNIIQTFCTKNNLEQIRIDIATSTKIDSISSKFTNDLLFSKASLFKIYFLTSRITEEIKKFLICELERKNTDNFFIFYFKQNIKDFSKLSWSKSLKEKSLILEANEPTPEYFQEAITLRAKFYNLSFTNDALFMLAELCQRNFLLVENELIKLQLIFNNDEIDTKKLAYHLSNGSNYDVFDLINASMTGNKKTTVASLRCLYENGLDPLSINGLFAWIFKAIFKFKSSNNISPSYNEFNSMRIFGSSQLIVKRSLKFLSKKQIEAVLIRIKDIDLICKGINRGDPWLELNRLSFGLSRILNKTKV